MRTTSLPRWLPLVLAAAVTLAVPAATGWAGRGRSVLSATAENWIWLTFRMLLVILEGVLIGGARRCSS